MPRFDCAIWRPISSNTGGTLSPNLGLILHHAVANGSLWSFFNNPVNQVSAHFWVAKNGTIEQYVDTNVVAWHGKQLNTRYVGVETEGCQSSPYAEPMTEAMKDALGRLYAEGMRRHGWIAAAINQDGQNGFGYHRMAVQTACPCDVRLNARGDILARAVGKPPAKPEPPQEVPKSMIATDPETGGTWWIDNRDGHVEADNGAPYLGGLNNVPSSPTSPNLKYNISKIGVIDGITSYQDRVTGKWGYVVSVRRNSADNGKWAAYYRFPR